MEPDGDSSPFWSQPRRHRNPPSPLLNPVVLILAVPILLLLVLVFILPPFVSHASQLIRPNSVKKSWDYFNIVLVLFAILCGVFARRNDDVPDEGVVPRQNSVDTSVVSNFVNEPRHSVVNWLEYPDRKVYANATPESGGLRLRRSSSSYPDLRNESLWGSGGNGNELRFHDDFEVKFYQSPETEHENYQSPEIGHENENLNLYVQIPQIHSSTVVSEEDVRSVVTSPVREIPIDKFEASSSEAPENPPPPPENPQPPPENPPPPAAPLKKRRSRSHRSVPRRSKRQVEIEAQEEAQIIEPPPLPEKVEEVPEPEPEPEPEPMTMPEPELVPEPKPEPEPEFQFPDVISETVPKKRSGVNVKKEFATAIASLYKGQKRKKKKRVKSRDIYETAPENSSSPPPAAEPEPQSAPVPPPPPPPPPPSKMLQNLFKKGTKTKRVHSVSTASPAGAPPPPPPPPPPNSIFNNLFKTGSKSSRPNSSSHAPPLDPPPAPPPPPSSILNSIFKTGSISRRFKHPPPPPPPPPSEPRRSFGRPPKPPRPSNQYAESAIYAPQSPLIPMPPPPPPFRMPEVKFVARGDFVRIQSASSSMCSSPEREDFDTSSVKSDGQDLIGSSVTCPSPDVNTKADNFIARLRDEWRLEKMSSMKEKRTVG